MSKFQSIDMAKLRSGNGVKWGDNDDQTLCAWVADMDFGVPEPVKAAMHSLVENEDFGYPDRKSTRLNSSHSQQSRMPSSA